MKTDERINLEGKSNTELFLIRRHLFAYEYASGFASDVSVLDYGSGVGYGSALLAKSAKSVVGYDTGKEAVQDASRKYSSIKNLKFMSKKPDGHYNLVTSFQVIEHIQNDGEFLKELTDLLAENGVLLITTPNSELRSLDGTPRNEYHIREYSLNQLIEVCKENLEEFEILGINGNLAAVAGEKLRMKAIPLNFFEKLFFKGKQAEDVLTTATLCVGAASSRSIDFLIIARKK